MAEFQQILPRDLENRMRDTPANLRGQIKRDVRKELYGRAYQFGHSLRGRYEQNPKVTIKELEAQIGRDKGLSGNQKELFEWIVEGIDQMKRYSASTKERVSNDAENLFQRINRDKPIPFTPDEVKTKSPNVMGALFYGLECGKMPKGKVILTDNDLVVELLVDDLDDLDFLELHRQRREGVDGVRPNGFYRDHADFKLAGTAPRVAIYNRGEEANASTRQHEMEHHFFFAVQNALGIVYKDKLPRPRMSKLIHIESDIRGHNGNLAKNADKYKKELAQLRMHYLREAKEEIFAFYRKYGVFGPGIMAVWPQKSDMGQPIDLTSFDRYTNYDYFYRDFHLRWSHIPQELKELIYEEKRLYSETLERETDQMNEVLRMADTFGVKDKYGGIVEGILYSHPIEQWGKELRKTFGVEMEVYKEFKELETKTYIVGYHSDDQREKVIAIGKKRSEIIRQLQELIAEGTAIKDVFLQIQPSLVNLLKECDAIRERTALDDSGPSDPKKYKLRGLRGI